LKQITHMGISIMLKSQV